MTPTEFRSHFPTLADQVYLCSCSQGAPSLEVEAALDAHRESWRTRGASWGEWMAEVDRARSAFARLIGAHEDEVAVVANASEGAYQVASTLPVPSSLPNGERRDRIVTSDLEFPSVAHVWLAQRARGYEVAFASPGDDARRGPGASPHARGAAPSTGAAPPASLEPDDVLAACDERTALVSLPLVSYANGFRPDLAAVIRAAHEKGVRVFVDAYQGAGVVPIDVHALGCDYLVAGALKYLLGIPGIAFLYVRRDLVDRHVPTLTGWFGRENPYAFDPRTLDFAPGARRFETGTPAIAAAYAAAAGMELLATAGVDGIWRHVSSLADRLQAALLAAGFRLYSPTDPARRGSQVTVVLDDPDADAARLAEERIFTSPRGRALRLSLHGYNDADDVDAAVAALVRLARGGVQVSKR